MNLVLPDHATFTLADATDIAVARRGAVDAARRLGLNEIDSGRAALVVTEAATNILKHAGRGELLIRPLFPSDGDSTAPRSVRSAFDSASSAGVEVIALDNGPGIADLNAAFKDGHSSTHTSGTGLGTMLRLSDDFAIYSKSGFGTVIQLVVHRRVTGDAHAGSSSDEHAFAAVHPWTRRAEAAEIDIGSIGVCHPREDVSGDAWSIETDATGLSLLVVDGLGHGLDARIASSHAVSVFQTRADRLPGEQLELMHLALKSTRGAAAAIARVDLVDQSVMFAGIGNIAASVSGEYRTDVALSRPSPLGTTRLHRTRQLTSYNGIVGHGMRKPREFKEPWPGRGMLIMHSDGLATSWDVSRYPGLSGQRAALIAAVLYRDFSRRNDDATVVVVKVGPSTTGASAHADSV